MPYIREGNCVYKKNADGSKGAKVGCSDSEEQAEVHLKALYANTEDAKEVKSDFTVEKDAKNQLRWVLFTSSAFEDKDGEIIAEKALQDDCAQMELTGDYGELLWWHCDGDVHANLGEKDARPYIPLGKCDFSIVSNKINIESGTFYDEEVGKRILEKSSKLGASKSFWHDQPQDNVYHSIRTKERSIMFRPKEANFLTRLFNGSRG